jgi:hypothetical protein
LHDIRVVPTSRLRFFLGSCILVGGVLLKVGAPVATVAAGMILALGAIYLQNRRSTRSPR